MNVKWLNLTAVPLRCHFAYQLHDLPVIIRNSNLRWDFVLTSCNSVSLIINTATLANLKVQNKKRKHRTHTPSCQFDKSHNAVLYMAESAKSPGILTNIFLEIMQSPLNIALVGVIVFLVYKIFKSRNSSVSVPAPIPGLPKLKKRDFTIEELKKFDGNQEDGRVLVAVNGNVYDVTKGKRFYGPGGPYAAFGGKDASRGLATFDVTAAGEGYDDLSDLSTMEMDSIREWESQFKEKYDFVGRLLKPGEQPTNYSDEEDESASAGDKGEKVEKEEKTEKDKKEE